MSQVIVPGKQTEVKFIEWMSLGSSDLPLWKGRKTEVQLEPGAAALADPMESAGVRMTPQVCAGDGLARPSYPAPGYPWLWDT